MKIKFKNAVIIWSILAVSLIGKDIITEHTNDVDNVSVKVSDKGKYPFVITVYPMDAKIMIMNIKPKYKKAWFFLKGNTILKYHSTAISLKEYG